VVGAGPVLIGGVEGTGVAGVGVAGSFPGALVLGAANESGDINAAPTAITPRHRATNWEIFMEYAVDSKIGCRLVGGCADPVLNRTVWIVSRPRRLEEHKDSR
jgi:hypothetical protein